MCIRDRYQRRVHGDKIQRQKQVPRDPRTEMNVPGGGLTHVNEFHSDEMRIFRAGLRHSNNTIVHDDIDRSVRAYHDKMNYERGFIQHSRSPSNQYVNFHFMYGGLKKYFLQRHLYQTWYRRNIRNFWFPALFSYTLGCITMRMYDNGAYDYFYFSDQEEKIAIEFVSCPFERIS
eukprot:TRINITY_DN4143_c0_g1_i1.p1 TRINITY_DN4143_c0_g1~~TRINITY_DN4143_c0_g1_i1.p1  ORF type:complete len:175 (+),score=57.57 TRINITY_DN4143_c0_g1_i1:68-592(+)